MSRLNGQHLREGSGRGGVQRKFHAMKHCCGMGTFANYVARKVWPSTYRPATTVRSSRTVCSRALRTSLTAHRPALYPLSIASHHTKKAGNVTKYSRHKRSTNQTHNMKPTLLGSGRVDMLTSPAAAAARAAVATGASG